MSSTIQRTASWANFSKIRRFVIFGDSYSSVQRAYSDTHRPSVEHPLGLAFPGSTFNFPDANWVGYMIKEYGPEPRFQPGATPSAAYQERPYLIHDYARGGDTVNGIRRQVEQEYLPGVGQKPDWAPWTPEETLFVTWVGINDCGLGLAPVESMEKLFTHLEKVYETGARNFLFIDVPTIHLSPAVPVKRQETTLLKIEHWNNTLKSAIEAFCKERPDVNAFLWSSFSLFNRLIHYPKQFGFDPKQVKKSRGDFWEDHIHPTRAVHEEIAKDVVTFLNSLSGDDAGVEPETTKGSWIKRMLF